MAKRNHPSLVPEPSRLIGNSLHRDVFGYGERIRPTRRTLVQETRVPGLDAIRAKFIVTFVARETLHNQAQANATAELITAQLNIIGL